MNQALGVLKRCAVFRDIPEDRLKKEILPLGKLREVPKDQYLIMYQERIDVFGVVLSGRIHTMHIFSDGNCSIIDVIEKGEIVGLDLMCTRSRVSPYYAAAATASRVLYFPISMVTERGMITEECRQMIIGKLLVQISHDNIRKQYRLAILSQKGLRERIMIYLTMQAGKRHTATFEIPFSREELASFLCVNRSALSHELGRMRREGLIQFHKNVFTLPHWEGADPGSEEIGALY